MQSKSPSDLEFAPRRPSFEIEKALATDWHSGSSFKTAYFNALSMLFPIGEKFFIDSVRYFNDQIEDPRLIAEVTAFQGQESVHRLEHQRYNETLRPRAPLYDMYVKRHILSIWYWRLVLTRPRRLVSAPRRP